MLISVVKGIVFMYEAIERAISRAQESPELKDHEAFIHGLDTAQGKLDKYFKLLKNSDLYYTAVALHPTHRLDWFEDK